MASLLLLIKNFAWWYTGSVSILAALVDSLVDIGASLTNLLVVRYSRNLPTIITRLVTVKLSPSRRWRKVCLSPVRHYSCFDGYSTSGISNTDDNPGVGVIVTIVALICTIILVSFQRWVVRRTQSRAVRADMLHITSLML